MSKFLLILLLLMLTNELTLQCLENEREVLLSIKQHWNDPYGALDSWVGEDCCKWKRIKCNNHTSHVIELVASGRYLQGTIPSTLAKLSALQVLRLSSNEFSGLIPTSLSQLSNLTKLDLSGNLLLGSIPASFGKFQNLKNLHFENNQLVGSIPVSLGKFSTLELLDLRGNKFGGLIPGSLVKLSNLTELDLSYNSFHGPIPKFFGEFKNLKELRLDGNHLNGVVPESLGNLSELTTLILRDNFLEGFLSEVHSAQLHNLKEIDLSTNPLTLNIKHGWIPPFQIESICLQNFNVGPQFPQWLQTQTMINYLYMNNASISDSIPNWFANISKSMSIVDLSGNKIYGKIPHLLASSNINQILLHGNLLEGPLPKFPINLKVLDLSDNKISGPLSENIVDLFPHLEKLVLSKNHVSGSIPNSICKILSLSLLFLSHNHLSGEIPQCLGQLQRLEVIYLINNNLSGRIPSSIGNLSLLQTLHLSNNNFLGQLPSTMRDCTSLVLLDLRNNSLSGRIPSWIGENLVSLRFLNLRSNKYTGVIPQKLCYLNNIQILDVAGNNLTGNVPRCFGNFTAMVSNGDYTDNYNDLVYSVVAQVIKGREDEYSTNLQLVFNLDLSDNNFVGHIPQEITTLHALRNLNLSRNQLTGNIPKEIGQLRSLESLDLAENHLFGPIPESISSIFGLEALNLSFNNLSGPIPKGTQIETLGDQDPSIYAGNDLLCGASIKRKCSRDETAQSPIYIDRDSEGGENNLIGKWFYIGLSSGFVVGFCGVCGFLLLNGSLRRAYFKFFEGINDKLYVTTTTWMLRMKVGQNQE